jgi:hypothetical protein
MSRQFGGTPQFSSIQRPLRPLFGRGILASSPLPSASPMRGWVAPRRLRVSVGIFLLNLMKITALLATYNEQRYIATCVESLIRQHVEVYLIDNESTDRTVEIARTYEGSGLIGIERFPRAGMYTWKALLERKEALASELDSDWFLHVDADEIRLPPPRFSTLAEAFAEVERQGFNAVNFQEFTFVPTQEFPDHEHSDYLRTMRWYYPFLPFFPHRLNAWRRQARVELAWSGGHQVRFPGLRMFPESFPMRHYMYLSVPHAIEKYTRTRYDPAETRMGWHGWRARVNPEQVSLPSLRELREYTTDGELDASNPRRTHFSENWGRPESRTTRAVRRCLSAASSLGRRLIRGNRR